MGLLQNGFRDSLGAFRYFGAGGINGAFPYALPANFHLTARQRNLTAGEGIRNKLSGLPSGHRHPSTWSMAQKPGGISAGTTCAGVAIVAASGAAGYGIDGSSVGAGALTGSSAAVIWCSGSCPGGCSLSASLPGLAWVSAESIGLGGFSGSVFAAVGVQALAEGIGSTSGDASLSATMQATSAGAGLAEGGIGGLLQMLAAAHGSGDGDAVVAGLYHCTGSCSGAGEADNQDAPEGKGWLVGVLAGDCAVGLTPYAKGSMVGTTDVSAGQLTADAVADAVWSYSR